MARQRHHGAPNMPGSALGNCGQRAFDRTGKPLDERFDKGRGLTEILSGFAAADMALRLTLHQDHIGVQFAVAPP